MHRASYLSVAEHLGHGVGLYAIEDEEPWAATLRSVILADEDFQDALAGLL